MTSNKSIIRVAAVVLGLAAANSAVAQDSASPQAGEEITVQAPHYIVKREPIPGHKTLINAEVVSISHPVSYADLDLSKPTDAAMLKKRVSDAADDVCRELNMRYPKTVFRVVYGKEDCVKSAVNDAMAVVNEVISASKS